MTVKPAALCALGGREIHLTRKPTSDVRRKAAIQILGETLRKPRR
jgi:hypothetical protein